MTRYGHANSQLMTLLTKIEVGDIVMDENARLKRRTNWGWDCDVGVVEWIRALTVRR
jgi:hypothetical protein